MKLSSDLLSQICFGKVAVTQNPDGVIFNRISKKASQGFATIRTDFFEKCSASACVNFEFYTDSKSFTFEYCNVVKGSSRNQYYFDVCINDALVLHYGFEDALLNDCGSFSLDLDGKLNKITVYSPNYVGYTLKSIVLDDGAQVIPVIKPYRILMLGDSITHGYDTVHPMNSYANVVARTLNADVVNQAIGGATAEAVTIDESVCPDIITVAYGTNDWRAKTYEDFHHDYLEYVEKLTSMYPNVPVFLMSPIYRKQENSPGTAGEFSVAHDIVKEASEKFGCNFVDAHSFVPHLPEFFENDGVHPNELGHLLYGIAVSSLLKDFLRK